MIKFTVNRIALILFTLFLSDAVVLSAQKVKDEVLKFSYHKLPSAPLNTSLKNYQSFVIATWEEKNDKLKAAHEQKVAEAKAKYARELDEYPRKVSDAKAKHEKELAAHPAKVKEAQDRYDKEMEEYKKMSAGDKLAERMATGSALPKPQLRTPSEPYYSEPSKPDYHEPSAPNFEKSYDYNVLASTYIKLLGFNKAPDNAIKITVTMYGFELTEPKINTTQGTVVEKGGSRSVNMYALEYSYRHPMAVKVQLPGGSEIMNTTPDALNNFVVIKGSPSSSSPSYSRDALSRTAEEKILQKNLTYIDSLVNDLYGYGLVKREVEFSFVKGDEYPDLTQAFNETTSALLQFEGHEKQGMDALVHPIEVWEKNLAEYVPGAKKARIDDDLAYALAFNLLEAYYLSRDVEKMQAMIQRLNTMDLSSRKRKVKATYDLLLSDLKMRKEAQPK